jgi:hypothetical protein
MLNVAAKEGLSDAGGKALDNVIKHNPNGIMDGVVKEGLTGAATAGILPTKNVNFQKGKQDIIEKIEKNLIQLINRTELLIH